MFFAALLNSLRFVRVLLHTFCSKFVLLLQKLFFLFTTVNGLILFSIHSRLFELVFFVLTTVRSKPSVHKLVLFRFT